MKVSAPFSLALFLAAVAAAAALPAAGAGVSARRSLREYAGICEQGYLITGECVYDYGMAVEGAGSEVKRFDEPCSWTPSLAQLAENAVECIQDKDAVTGWLCKRLKLTAGVKGFLLCNAVCNGIQGVKDALVNSRDCRDNGKKDGSAGGMCFPGAARVVRRHGGAAPLSAVRPGEEILAVTPDGKTVFSQMFMLSAPVPTRRASFVRLLTEAGLNVTITPNHYLFSLPAGADEAPAGTTAFLHAWRYTLPSEIAVGDLLPVVPDRATEGLRFKASPVVNIEMVEDVGIYMPHTSAGAVVVDGVVATELTTVAP